MLKRTVVTLVGVVGLCLFVGHCVEQANVSRARQAAFDAKLRADRAVSVLPAGIENAWDSWVDEEVARKVERAGPVVRLDESPDSNPDPAPWSVGTVYVSVNSPFQVQCSTDVTVLFAQAPPHSDASDASVTIDTPWTGWPPLPLGMSGGKGTPPVGVPSDSIAAQHLAQRLCARVADDVARVMR